MNKIKIDELRNKFNNGYYEPLMPYPKREKISNHHIFDENKSVKWNREQVDIKNKLNADKFVEYRKAQNKLDKLLFVDSVNALMCDYPKIKHNEAEHLQQYVYNEYHSSMNEYFSQLDSLGQLVSQIIEIGNN